MSNDCQVHCIGVNALLERSSVIVSKKESDAGQMISQSLHLFRNDDLAIEFVNKEKEERTIEKLNKMTELLKLLKENPNARNTKMAQRPEKRMDTGRVT